METNLEPSSFVLLLSAVVIIVIATCIAIVLIFHTTNQHKDGIMQDTN